MQTYTSVQRRTHTYMLESARLNTHSSISQTVNTFSPTLTDKGTHTHIHTSKGWKDNAITLRVSACGMSSNTERVSLLPNTMEREPLYFSGNG